MLTRRRVGLVVALTLAVLTSGVLHAQALLYRPQFARTTASETRGAFTGGTPTTVWLVNTLADTSGAGTVVTANNCAAITCRRGSFRMAFEDTTSTRRLILFETSGYFTLTGGGAPPADGPYLLTSNGNITIAGQSAPDPGVTVRGGGTYFNTGAANIVIQHMRFRPGNDICNTALGFGPYSGLPAPDNIVIDHASVSWPQDDGIFFHSLVTNTFVWRSIVAEGLFNAACDGGTVRHGIAGTGKPGAIIQSLLAHNEVRNPYIASGTSNVLLNNVLYNWGGPWGFFHNNVTSDGVGDGPPWYTTAIGNVFLGGLDSGNSYAFSYVPYGSAGDVPGNQIYGADNVIDSWALPLPDTVQPQANGYSYNPNVSSPPTSAPIPAGFTPLAGGATQAFVLANAGARPANRDAVDSRVTASVTNKSGRWISTTPTYPTLAVNTVDLTDDIPANPFADPDLDGYTNIEEWLEMLAINLEGEAGGGEPDDECVTPCAFVVSAGSVDGASVTTAPIDTADASLYVAGVCNYGGGTAANPGALSTVSVPTDVWTPLTKRGNTNAVGRLYYALNPSVGSTRTFTVAAVTDSYPALVVYGFSDRASTSVLDLESGASATGTVTSLAPGTMSPTTNNQVLTTLVNSYTYGAAPTVTGGILVPPEAVQPWVGSLRVGCAMGYLAQTAATLANPTWSFTSTDGAAAMAGWKVYTPDPPEIHPRRFRLE